MSPVSPTGQQLYIYWHGASRSGVVLRYICQTGFSRFCWGGGAGQLMQGPRDEAQKPAAMPPQPPTCPLLTLCLSYHGVVHVMAFKPHDCPGTKPRTCCNAAPAPHLPGGPARPARTAPTPPRAAPHTPAAARAPQCALSYHLGAG